VAGSTVVVDTQSLPEQATSQPSTESAPEPAEGGGRRGRTGSLIWLAIVVGWILLQLVQAIGGGDGSP
jgi:hypothetical protein